MIPTIADGPDPEGAAILLESLAATSLKLKIDTSTLRQKVEEIKQHLQEFLRMHKQQMQQYEQAASREAERIYK
jgi:predicted ATP-grasp superfamily ATP-dependent carboligase